MCMLKRREPPALDIFLEHHTRQGEDTMISILHVIEDIEKKEKKIYAVRLQINVFATPHSFKVQAHFLYHSF
jgi:hypothetical protein